MKLAAISDDHAVAVREAGEHFDPASILETEFDVTLFKSVLRVYGKNGVMGELEPVKTPAHELCIIVEVSAATQGLATEEAAHTRDNGQNAEARSRVSAYARTAGWSSSGQRSMRRRSLSCSA